MAATSLNRPSRPDNLAVRPICRHAMKSEERLGLEEPLTRDAAQLASAVDLRQFGAIPEHCDELIERLGVLTETAQHAADRRPYMPICEWAVDQARAAIANRTRLSRVACHQWARDHRYDPDVIENIVAAGFLDVLHATERIQRIIRAERSVGLPG